MSGEPIGWVEDATGEHATIKMNQLGQVINEVSEGKEDW